MKAQFILVALVVAGLMGCTKAGDYQTGQIGLGLNFISKSMCDCLWVSKSTEDLCRDHVKIDQVNPSIKVDWEKKSVEASFFWFLKGRAEFTSDRLGCHSVVL